MVQVMAVIKTFSKSDTRDDADLEAYNDFAGTLRTL